MTKGPGEIPDLFEALMDHLPEAIYFKDRESRFIRINKALAGWYRLGDPAQAIGKSDRDYFTPEFAKGTYDLEQEIIRTGQPRLDIEEKLVWPDGRVTWSLTSKMPFRDKTGAVSGTFGVSRDISAYKAAQEAVRHAEALYRSLVDNLPQNFFRKDVEGRVVYANQEYCRTMGKTLKELLGKTDLDLFPAELARKYREDDQRVMQTGAGVDLVEAHRTPQGKHVFVRVVKTPVWDANRRILGVQGIFWEVPATS